MSVISLEQAKAKILVVDDRPENLHLLSDALSGKGYDVKCVVNGEMALIVANTVIPDLILLDVIMPGIDGYQVCKRLKSDRVTTKRLLFPTAQ